MPRNATNLVVRTSGGSGDVDLYVCSPDQDERYYFDECAESDNDFNNENITIANPGSVTYVILLEPWDPFSNVRFRASYDVPQINYTPLAIDAGGFHTCALEANQVRCWGRNDYGQTNVPSLFNPKAVTAGVAHSCALDSQGVKCWGINSDGVMNVPALSNPVAVSAGGEHTCALDDTGVVCWGSNEYGQTDVPELLNPRAIDAGLFGVCALHDRGVSCWGAQGNGVSPPADLMFDQDGDGVTSQYGLDAFPNDPGYSSDNDSDGLPDQWETVNGYDNTVDDAVSDVDGDDLNGTEEFAAGTRGDRVDTDADTLPDGWEIGEGRDPTRADYAVSAGLEHTCALDDTGVVCWGFSGNGQTDVPPLSNPTVVSAGGFHTCAVSQRVLL